MEQARQIRPGNRSDFGSVVLLLLYNTVASVGLLLASPVLLALVIASRKRRSTVRQRLGCWRYPWQSSLQEKPRVKIWVHALSVGEVTAAQPLVEMVKDQHPELKIIFSVSTLTGYQTACRLFADDQIDLAYFPYDLIWSVRTMADKIDARAVVLVETDIWPNFLAEMKRRNVPIYLVNLRLSDGAWKSFRRFKWFAGKLFGAFDMICVQTPRDARRLIGLGIAKERLCVTGNIKFDGVSMAAEGHAAANWRKKLPLTSTRQIVVAGSTHDGEELFLLDALLSIIKEDRMVCLIIAPRNPNRAKDVLKLSENKGLTALRLSELLDGTMNHCPDVIVVDFIGALKELYSLADVSFVGGSLVKEGGHNPLEPAIFGRPVVFGPDMRDFRHIAAWLLHAGGARQVSDRKQLAKVFSQLLNDPQLAASMGERARQVVLLHQGAVMRTVKSLELMSL